MRKFLLIYLGGIAAIASATNLQMWYRGAWESTVQYSVKPISGSSTAKTSPVVTYSGSTYIANGESTVNPPKGSTPASAPAYWDAI